MSNLPWSEKVNMLSINPDAASREDIAKMAAELSEKDRELQKAREERDRAIARAENIEESWLIGRLPLGVKCKVLDDAIARAESAEAALAKSEAARKEAEAYEELYHECCKIKNTLIDEGADTVSKLMDEIATLRKQVEAARGDILFVLDNYRHNHGKGLGIVAVQRMKRYEKDHPLSDQGGSGKGEVK